MSMRRALNTMFKPGGAPPPAWANAYALRCTGTSTSDAGRVNLGQPSAWNVNLAANEFTITGWLYRDGDDGFVISHRSNAVDRFSIELASGNFNVVAGGNFMSTSGLSFPNATWEPWTFTSRNESGTYVSRLFVGNSSTSRANVNSGSTTGAVDWLLNARRGLNNTDIGFGTWGVMRWDELHFWDIGFTGDDHMEWRNGGTPMDATTHSRAANLINGYRCGDSAGDVSPVLKDYIGTNDGSFLNASNVAFVSL